MSERAAYSAARIFDGEAWHEDAAILTRDGLVEAVLPIDRLPAGTPVHRLDGGMIVPGFVDLQVNGGGGLMLNDRQDVETIRTICSAHAQFGTTALLPTLITDTAEVIRAAVAAGEAAARENVPGFLGLHLEGPHLSAARKGAHDPALIRPMSAADEAFLIDARRRLPALLVTLAPETVPPQRIARLAKAGIVVSLGHTDTDHATMQEAASAGARMVTHLFNAMSQIGNREPGVAGATLDIGLLYAGLIADGIHVAPATMGLALRAKKGPGRIFLVTDAMATVGTDLQSFTLNGRTILRDKGRLTLADGTLAGSDLDMIAAVRLVHRALGLPLEEALRMAALYPAEAMSLDAQYGRLAPGARADFLHLSDNLEIGGVWIGAKEAA
ncbi:N-acetylglucosamine-6-phosphate deacetylase [Mesorhizobium xinjiangense]|uniref:N-acetylglucosamine-6-phosphate deacetylase n=1 Tax=Mesorhizobium xinjiangense TaxID=2678685 RepID=UPI0012EE62D1|nr:N-acetylglucosamine-6-phosphate deacetylase [Mesorhizobium xinjiangense]